TGSCVRREAASLSAAGKPEKKGPARSPGVAGQGPLLTPPVVPYTGIAPPPPTEGSVLSTPLLVQYFDRLPPLNPGDDEEMWAAGVQGAIREFRTAVRDRYTEGTLA